MTSAHRSTFQRRRVLIPAAIVLVIAVGIGSFVAWYHRSAESIAGDAAGESHVEIPADATEVAAAYDRVRIQGGCSRVTFLLPSSQWRSYVGQYDRKPLTPTSYGPSTSCGDIPFACVEAFEPNGLTAFVTKTAIDDGSKYRHLFVVEECKPGRALISWSTFDL